MSDAGTAITSAEVIDESNTSLMSSSLPLMIPEIWHGVRIGCNQYRGCHTIANVGIQCLPFANCTGNNQIPF